MSKYNTANESKIQPVTAVERNDVYSHRTKRGISKKHEKVLGELFFSLAKAKADGVKTDHSPSNPNTRTLDIYQVQQLIQSHCGKLITHMEIVDALYDLTDPELVKPSTTTFNSELDGKRINAIRLIYNCSRSGNCDTGIADSISETTQTFKKLNQVLKEENALGNAAIKNRQDNTATPETDEIALELSQVTFNDTADEIDKCDASRRWIERAMYLEESHIEQQDTIQSLRAIIIDMAETLHVADPNARISMTSSDLLDLVHSQKDMSDNAF